MTATALLMDDVPAGAATAHSRATEELAEPQPDVAAVVAELGLRQTMPVTSSDVASLTVELDVPGAWAIARWVAATDRVEVRLAAEVASWSAAGGEALALLLDRVAGGMVGIDADADKSLLSTAIAHQGDTASIAGALVGAFEALTVAARLTAAEAEALAADDALARRYVERITQPAG